MSRGNTAGVTERKVGHMGDVREIRQDDYNGLCPKCHKGGLNMHSDRKTHWSVCEKHKLKWCTGYGLISFPFTDDYGEWSWDSGDELLKHNRFMLAGYRTVEPFFWPHEQDSESPF